MIIRIEDLPRDEKPRETMPVVAYSDFVMTFCIEARTLGPCATCGRMAMQCNMEYSMLYRRE